VWGNVSLLPLPCPLRRIFNRMIRLPQFPDSIFFFAAHHSTELLLRCRVDIAISESGGRLCGRTWKIRRRQCSPPIKWVCSSGLAGNCGNVEGKLTLERLRQLHSLLQFLTKGLGHSTNSAAGV
jgi:hypothetical protein